MLDIELSTDSESDLQMIYDLIKEKYYNVCIAVSSLSKETQTNPEITISFRILDPDVSLTSSRSLQYGA